MHVALFSPGWPLASFHNGIVTYVHWMRLELERQGHRVSIFTGTSRPAEDGARVHVVRRGRFGASVRRLAKPFFPPERNILEWGGALADSLRAVHRNDPIDVIEMEESFGWSADVEQRTGIPVLVKLHGPAFLSLVEEELTQPFGQARVSREGASLRRAASIASPSDKTLQQTLERYGLEPPIREHVVNPLTMDPDVPLWRLGSCSKDTILFVGRFDSRKGGDIVLRAFERLLRERRDLKLIFVGPDVGLLRPGGQRVHLEAYCGEIFSSAQRERVRFLGRLENSEIPALRAGAMVTVIPSRWENQGYSVLEAMYQGCPIVASDVGGNPECVIANRTGLLARSEDADDFAAQIARMLDDPLAAAAMGAEARRHVIEHHSAARVASESLILYERVIAQARG